MQNVGSGQKSGGHQYVRHDTTVSAGRLDRSARRQSDEMGIIVENWDSRDGDSGYDQDSAPGRTPHAIQKNMSVSVLRN